MFILRNFAWLFLVPLWGWISGRIFNMGRGQGFKLCRPQADVTLTSRLQSASVRPVQGLTDCFPTWSWKKPCSLPFCLGHACRLGQSSWFGCWRAQGDQLDVGRCYGKSRLALNGFRLLQRLGPCHHNFTSQLAERLMANRFNLWSAKPKDLLSMPKPTAETQNDARTQLVALPLPFPETVSNTICLQCLRVLATQTERQHRANTNAFWGSWDHAVAPTILVLIASSWISTLSH